jgi:DNA-binding NarL/FixJ family response regulator
MLIASRLLFQSLEACYGPGDRVEDKHQHPTALKVVIIEDQEGIRDGLRILIDSAAGRHCIAACSTMEQALKEFARDVPDVALVDIGLPGISGIEGIRMIAKEYPTVQAIVLTIYDDDQRIFQALCAGAVGYLLKNTTPERLIEAIGEVANGGSPVSPEIARRVVTLFRKFRPIDNAGYALTPHESRILKLLVDGHNYKTAAKELRVSVNTISFHVRRIYEKLQVHSKSEAVAKALRCDLLR